jgi:hypothetical protein
MTPGPFEGPELYLPPVPEKLFEKLQLEHPHRNGTSGVNIIKLSFFVTDAAAK